MSILEALMLPLMLTLGGVVVGLVILLLKKIPFVRHLWWKWEDYRDKLPPSDFDM